MSFKFHFYSNNHRKRFIRRDMNISINFTILVLLFLCTFDKIQSVRACDDDSDCTYNGKCEDDTCRCEDAFRGERCDVFRFVPRTYVNEGLRTLEDNGTYTSSWGGSVLLDDDGVYHMWASEMTFSTGIKAWLTNSRIVHAVADDSQRPFVFRRTNVVHPVFAHEPTVSRDPTTGDYVMFYTSNYGEKPGSQCSAPCLCGHNGTSCLSCLNDQQCDAEPRSPLSSFMSFAKTPNGPWSTPELISAPTEGDTNLACIINEDSSLICMGRPGLGRMYSSDWRNVSSYVWQDTKGDPIVGEDPMIWRDETHDDVIHLVTHGGGTRLSVSRSLSRFHKYTQYKQDGVIRLVFNTGLRIAESRGMVQETKRMIIMFT